ncbi:hypothetical protein IWQ60_006855 [Tieghemiomyces parasiticus]|uniref:Radical S-adenosyl methionine domain-containing protein 1, mitochondrial n=1 Tax=Tieghemiomyces parasiticus TaxID=78921 RepID=A0A9W8A9I2_9FUNG|nr:hypothetical protein IWQ60_006855 [Tieghemiomyces parasiticus]
MAGLPSGGPRCTIGPAPARPPLAVYVHWPYCESKCTYCDFNKYVDPAVDHKRMSQALETELATSLAPERGRQIRSVYFGGGTPSLARPATLARVLEVVRRYCQLPTGKDGESVEVTLEANPTSLEVAKLRDFQAIGINRLSLGVQSLDDRALSTLLGRNHSAADALRALGQAQRWFPGRTTFDLIYGRPGQTLNEWRQELRTALACTETTPHVSLYELTWKRGTPLYRDLEAGRYRRPDPDLLSDMYETTVAICAEHGLQQYEVSNFARIIPSQTHSAFGSKGPVPPILEVPETLRSLPSQSLHNSAYWRGLDYIGVGPGAHGRITDPVTGVRRRTYRIPHPPAWQAQCETDGHGLRRTMDLGPRETLEELFMFSLRMREGLPETRFHRHTAAEAGVAGGIRQFVNGEQLELLLASGHLEWVEAPFVDDVGHCTSGSLRRWQELPTSMVLRPTTKGLPVIDSIIPRLIA